MTAAFFVALREGLEIAMIVGLIVACLAQAGRRDAVRWVVLGVAIAGALVVVVGIVVFATIGRLPVVVQQVFEGLTVLVAIVASTWTLFWMRRQRRTMRGELEASVATALERGSVVALVGLAVVAVLREGLESIFLLLAILGATGDIAVGLAWALAGLGTAAAIGWAVFSIGVRIDLARFFTVTCVILIFATAGLCAYLVGGLTAAGWLSVTPVVFDVSALFPQDGPIGSTLGWLVGYRATPSFAEVAAYLAYLVPVLVIFLWPGPAPRSTSVVARSGPPTDLIRVLVPRRFRSRRPTRTVRPRHDRRWSGTCSSCPSPSCPTSRRPIAW